MTLRNEERVAGTLGVQGRGGRGGFLGCSGGRKRTHSAPLALPHLYHALLHLYSPSSAHLRQPPLVAPHGDRDHLEAMVLDLISLPSDVLITIMQCFSAQDLARFSCACKVLHNWVRGGLLILALIPDFPLG